MTFQIQYQRHIHSKEEIMDKLDLIKIKNCSVKTLPREQKKPQSRRKYLQKTFDKGLLSKIRNENFKLISKEATQFKKEPKV